MVVREKIDGFARRFEKWTSSTKGCLVAYSVLYLVVLAFVLFPLVYFGKSMFWVLDGTTQAYAYFAYFGHWVRDALYQIFIAHGDVSTWAPGRGYGDDLYVSFLPNFINPFTLVSVVVPSAYAEVVCEGSYFARLYCAGLLFFAYARLRGVPSREALLGCLCYVFAGTSVTMFAQPGFLSYLIDFPLLLCGVELVIAGRTPLVLVYAVCLSSSSVQSALLFAAFVAVYVVYRLFASPSAPPRAQRAGLLLRLAGYGLLSLAVAAVFLLPMLLNNMLGMERLSVDRTVPLLFSLDTYLSYYLGLVSHCALQADGFWGFGPVFLASFFLLCLRWRKNCALVLLFSVILLLACVPFLSSALNAFQYPNLRWFWLPAFAGAWVVMTIMGRFEELSGRETKLLVGAVLVYGALAALVPWGWAGSAFWMLYALALVTVGLVVAASRELLSRPQLYAALVAVVCMGGTINLATYIDPGYEGALRDFEDAGEAYATMTENSAVAALGPLDEDYHGMELSDEDLWRYDDAVDHAFNSSLFNERLGIDFYSSLYINEVDDFHRSVALNSSSTVSFLGLNSRSALEALLGVRYFVAPQSTESVIVPYQFDDLAYEYYGWDVLTTDRYLPLAFGVNGMLSRSSWNSLGFIERQAALMGSVVVEDSDLEVAGAPELTGQQALEAVGSPFSVPLRWMGVEREEEGGSESFVGKNAVVAESTTVGGDVTRLILSPLEPGEESGYVQRLAQDGGVFVRSAGSRAYLSFDAPAGSEVYVVFENLRFSPVSARDTYTDEEWEVASMLTQRSVEWRSALSGGARVAKVWAKGFEQTAWSKTSVYTTSYHMYAGHHDFALNLGVSDEPLTGAVLEFSEPGVYTYDSMSVWVQPMDRFDSAVESLQRQPATDLYYGNGVISGSIDMAEDGLLFLSVSYSDGWSCTVDGEPADVLQADVAFMAVPMAAGEHTFELRYATPYAFEGTIVSGISLAVLAVLLVRRRRRSR